MTHGKLFAATLAATMALGSSLPVLAMDSGMNSSTGMMMRADAKKTVDIACVQKVVAAREASLGSAWTTFAASMSTAYSTRASALNTAWGMADATARKAAQKAAWAKFATDTSAARKALKAGREAAWKKAKTDVKACRGASADAVVQAESAATSEKDPQ